MGEAEVHQLGNTPLGQHDVRGFDVPVHHAARVSVIECGGDGSDDAEGLVERSAGCFRGDTGLERFAFEKLHHEEALAHVENGDDVRVAQLAGRLGLAAETAQDLLLLPLGELL